MSSSTAFKADRPTAVWLPVLKKFLEHFPYTLTGHLALAFDEEPDMPTLELWKASGDELVFSAGELLPTARAC